MQKELQNWLNKQLPDWPTGYRLLEHFCPEKITHRMRARARHNWVPQQIREQARVILEQVIPKTTSTKHTTSPLATSRPVPDSQPPEIKQLNAMVKDLYRIYDLTHAEMRIHAESGQEEKAFACAQKIMEDLEPRLADLYGRIKGWESSGDIPIVPGNDEVRRGFELAKKLNKLRVQIAQAKKKGLSTEVFEARIKEIKNEIGL